MGSFEGSIGTPAGGFTLLVEYDYTQNTSANTTTFTSVVGYVKRNKSSYYPYNQTSAVALTVNGSTYTASPAYNLGSDGYKQIISVSNITIPHNADGTKTTSIGLSMDGKLSNYYPNGSISQSITLPTIPRASSVSASTANIGGAMNITVSRASSAFTHSLFYKYGSTGWVRIATGVATSYQWTVPTSLYSAIPTSNSLALTIAADTYSGGTMIGSKTCATTVYVANSNPTCTLTAKDVNAATIALTGSAAKMVRYMSNIQYTATPAAKNAATISKTTISCSDGQSSTALTGTFTSAGGNKITAVTVDSRGNKGEAPPVTLPMVDYFRPVIKEATLYRINTTSATVKLDYALSCFAGDFGAASNTFVLSFRWREAVEGATWSDWAEITTTKTSETGHVLGEAYDWHKAYDFELRLEDKLASTTVARSVTKGIPIVEIGKNSVTVNGAIKASSNLVAVLGPNIETGDMLKYDGTKLVPAVAGVDYSKPTLPTTLWWGTINRNGASVTLSDSITNYTWIVIVGSTNQYNHYAHSNVFLQVGVLGETSSGQAGIVVAPSDQSYGMLAIATGATSGVTAYMRTNRILVANSGFGVENRITAVFGIK